MHIDWFTVIAQVLNFLVLMWLLKRFLYQPILNAIAAREKHIADQLADAITIDAKAKKEQADFEQKNEEFAGQKGKLLSDAKEEAQSEHDKLIGQAKNDAENLRIKRKEALDQEMHDSFDDTVKQLREEVFATTGKLLHDLADVSLEERMVAVFIKRLHELSAKDLSKLVADESSQEVYISSAFALSKALQTSLTKEIIKTLKTDKIIFKKTPELLSGIEISVAGQKLAWSTSNYLQEFEESIAATLKSTEFKHAA
jgi:F-type H+-transporting ATPase subunit b